MKLPPDLNQVAYEWRDVMSTIPITMSKDLQKHVVGTHSTYVLQIMFRRLVDTISLFYAGRTSGSHKNVSDRGNKHKSDVRTCRVTTFIGKSDIFRRCYIGGTISIDMNFTIIKSGMNKDEADQSEKLISMQLRDLHGADAVLTRPTGKSVKEPVLGS